MSAPWIRVLRGASLAAAAAAVAGAHAAVLTLSIPPFPPKTVTYNQCASFTFNGSTLTCVPTTTSPPPPIDPEQPPTSPGTPFDGCPSNALMIDAPWGTTSLNTFDFGYFGANILSVRVVVPLNATGSNTRTSSWAEYGSTPAAREAVFSTRACDFTNTYAVRNVNGAPWHSKDVSRFSLKYTIGPASLYVVHLQPGQVYYLNVRNQFGDGTLSCPLQSCSMRGGFPP